MIRLWLPLNLKIAALFLWNTLYRPSYLCFSTHWDLDEKPSPVGWAYLLGSCPITRAATTPLLVHFSSIPRMTTCQRWHSWLRHCVSATVPGLACHGYRGQCPLNPEANRNVCSVWSHHNDKLFVSKGFSPSPQKSPGLDWAFPPDQPKASGFVNPSFYKLDNRKPTTNHSHGQKKKKWVEILLYLFLAVSAGGGI